MSVSSLKILCRYQYTPLDQLSGVELLTGDSTQRFYQENHLTTELGQQTQRTIFRHQAQSLAQQQNEAGVSKTTLLATDRAHSLLRTVTGTNPQQFAYTAYGHYPIKNVLSQLLGFNGECPDAITCHYPLGQGNRFFNPVLMRFNSPDETSPFDEGGINSYAYCENDPINFSDPTGNVKRAIMLPNIKKVPIKKRYYAIKRTSTAITPENAENPSSLHPISGTSSLAPDTSTHIATAQPFPHKLQPSKFAVNNPKTKANYRKYNEKLNISATKYDKLITTPNFQTTSTEAMKTRWEDLTSRIKSKPHKMSLTHLKKQQAKLELQIKDFSIKKHELEIANNSIRN